MPKKLLLAVIAIVILIGVFIFFQSSSTQTYQTASVTRGTLEEHVKSSGNLQAGGVTRLYANATGVVKKLYVENGATVVKGQVIADIESTASEVDKAQTRAAYATALDNYQTAKQTSPILQSQLEAARKTVLDTSNAVNKLDERLATDRRNPSTGKDYTQEEIDSIRSSLTSARQAFIAAEQNYRDRNLTIQSAAIALEVAKLNNNATQSATLKATTDGTIVNLRVAKGDTITAGADNLPIPVQPLASIVDLSQYTMRVDINETRIGKIKQGQTVNIIFDSAPAETYSGTVRTKDTIGTNVQGLISYAVYITPEFLPDTIKPGMTANLEIVTDQKTGILMIPAQAIQKQKEQSFVQILDAQNQPQKREVITGITNNGMIEIIQGLQEGENVILKAQ